MTVEIRAVWIDGVRYTIEEARVLAKDLDTTLASLDMSKETSLLERFLTYIRGGEEIVSEITVEHKEAQPLADAGLCDECGLDNLGYADYEDACKCDQNAWRHHLPGTPRTHHCSTCGEEGHNKQTCKKADRSRTYCCSICGIAGHNRRTCGGSQ